MSNVHVCVIAILDKTAILGMNKNLQAMLHRWNKILFVHSHLSVRAHTVLHIEHYKILQTYSDKNI